MRVSKTAVLPARTVPPAIQSSPWSGWLRSNPSSPAGGRLRGLRVVAMTREKRIASDFPPVPTRYLWEGRIPEGFITVVAGRPGAGKSSFAAYLAAEVTKRGEQVICSAAENPLRQMTVPRLMAAGADLYRVDVGRLALPTDLDQLERTIVEDKVRLVMIDPLSAHLDGRTNRWSDSIRRVTTPLAEIAERTGCAIVLFEHVIKDVSSKTHPLRAIQGSGSGVAAAAQMVFVIGIDPDDDERVVLCPAKTNLRADAMPLEFQLDVVDLDDVGDIGALRLIGETTFDPRLLLVGGGSAGNEPPTKMAAARDWLTNYLRLAPNHRALARDIRDDAAQHGHTKKTLDRAAADLGVHKDPASGGRNCTWELPQKLRDAFDEDGTDGNDE